MGVYPYTNHIFMLVNSFTNCISPLPLKYYGLLCVLLCVWHIIPIKTLSVPGCKVQRVEHFCKAQY